MNTAPYQPYPDIRQYDPIRRTAGRPPGSGKPRKDYTAAGAGFDTLEEFQNALRQALSDARQDEYTERIAQSMTFSSSALLPIDHNNQLGQSSPPHDDQEQNNAFRSVYELCDYEDQKERHKWQRGAARGLIAAVREVDGFKYSVNNIWSSKDDKGFRFSYTCLDSLENKDRHANSLRKSAVQQLDTPPHTRARKETYDCGGQVSVKFSGARHIVEVIYKHTAVHTTVADRAPVPRTNRRNTLDQSPEHSEYSSFDQSFNDAAANFANSLGTPGNHAQPGQYSTPTQDAAPGPSRESNASGFTVQRWKTQPAGHRGRGRPRKDGQNPIPRNTQNVAAARADKPPSLAELLRLSAAENRPEPEIPGKPYQMPPPLPAGPYGNGPPGYTAPPAGPYNYPPLPPTAPTKSHAPYMSSVPQPPPTYQTAFPPPPPPSQPQQQQKAPRANAPMATHQHHSPAQTQQQKQQQQQQHQKSQSQPRAPSPDPWFPRR